jgi:hypothetical protein
LHYKLQPQQMMKAGAMRRMVAATPSHPHSPGPGGTGRCCRRRWC